jgi:type IV secretion system protein VirD4
MPSICSNCPAFTQNHFLQDKQSPAKPPRPVLFLLDEFDTADMLSKTMGRETITYETGGQSEKDVMVKDPERSFSKTQHLATRNLMDPNEIMKLTPDTLLLMRVGENPLIVKKLRYFADKEFAGVFDGV